MSYKGVILAQHLWVKRLKRAFWRRCRKNVMMCFTELSFFIPTLAATLTTLLQ